MWKAIVRCGLIVAACGLGFAQKSEKSPAFDVATVKPAAPLAQNGRGMFIVSGPSGGPGTKDPGRIHYPYMTLKNLLMTAYDVKNFQITGPAFLDTERFDIDATLPPDTTKEQFRIMLQNLLAERFKMTVHRDKKELPMYALVVAKGGVKMKEAAELPAPKDGADGPPPPPSQPKIGPDGFPVLPSSVVGRPGIFNIMMPGRARMMGVQQTALDLANRLTSQLNRPVTDETGLTPKYDFTLTFSTEGMNGPLGPLPPPPTPPGGGAGGGNANVFVPDGEAPQDIFAAVQAQLGLRLESKKGPVEMIVIDHIEKTPTEN